MNRVRAWAGRVAAWFRRQAQWISNQRALHAHNVQLEQQVAAMRAEHEREMAAFFVLHDEGAAKARATIARLDAECEEWKRLCGDAGRRVQFERVLGNKAWQEVARLKQQLAQREEVRHASAAVGD